MDTHTIALITNLALLWYILSHLASSFEMVLEQIITIELLVDNAISAARRNRLNGLDSVIQCPMNTRTIHWITNTFDVLITVRSTKINA
jgi:hypothetical protein